MKRILSVIMICALLVVGLAVVASAAPASITIDAQKTDDVVTAQIKLNGYEADSWSAMTTLVTYNSNALTFSNAESVMEGMRVESTAAGKLLLCWVADPLTVPADGVVATLTFAVKTVTEEEPIGLKVAFYPDGMALAGETTTMGNAGEENYSTAEAKPSESIVIRPEGAEDPDQPADPEEPTPNNQTVYKIVGPDNKVDFKIKATHQRADSIPMYKVNVSWETEGFVYTEKGTKWNPNEHHWVDTTPAKWEGTGVIKLENHSTYAVIATFDYTPDGNDTMMEFKQGETLVGESGISIDAPEVTPEGGEITSPGKAEVDAAITFGTIETGGKVGTIKVTIA